MRVAVEVVERLDEEAIQDLLWMDSIIKDLLRECKESYIGKNEVRIYINEEIGFLSLRKYKYQKYNQALIVYSGIIRDRMLNNLEQEWFPVAKFKEEVYKNMTKLTSTNFKDLKTDKVNSKKKRRRIPLNIEDYI